MTSKSLKPPQFSVQNGPKPTQTLAPQTIQPPKPLWSSSLRPSTWHRQQPPLPPPSCHHPARNHPARRTEPAADEPASVTHLSCRRCLHPAPHYPRPARLPRPRRPPRPPLRALRFFLAPGARWSVGLSTARCTAATPFLKHAGHAHGGGVAGGGVRGAAGAAEVPQAP